MLDFVYTFTVDIYGEGKGEFVTKNNYKEIIQTLEHGITSSENDNDLLDDRISVLAEKWYNLENKTQAAWDEMEKEWGSYTKQIEENKEYIKKCERTIELIEKFAEIREWE